MSSPSTLSAINKLRPLLSGREKKKWATLVVCAMVTSAFEILTALIIVLFIHVLNHPTAAQRGLSKVGLQIDLSDTPHHTIVLYLALAVGTTYLIKNSIAAAEVFYQNLVIQKMHNEFKERLLQRYALSDFGCFLTRNPALCIRSVSYDAEVMFTTGMLALASILSEGTIVLFFTGLIVYLNPSVAFIVFGEGGILLVAVTKVLLPRVYRHGQTLQEAAVAANQNLVQFFGGFKEIILLGKSTAFVKAYQIHSKKKTRVQAIQSATAALPRMFIEVIFIGLFILSIVIMCLNEQKPEQMMGILGGYLYAGFRVMPGLNRLINQTHAFKATIPSIEWLHDEYTTTTAKSSYIDQPTCTFHRSICLTNVSYRYLNTSNFALKGVSLEIRKGECLGIIGKTGSGKSTLVDLIL